MKKIILMLFAVCVISFLGAARANAAATQSITITISINATASVAVDIGTWDLTGSAFSTQYATGPFTVSNDGTVYETFKILGADSDGTYPWTMAAAVGANQFTVQALMGSDGAAAPTVPGDYAAEDILNNATYVTTTSTDLSNTTWDATTAEAVPNGSARDLFLLLSTPSSGYSSAASIGDIILTVSADAL